MPKLTQQLSRRIFIFSQLLILTAGLIFLTGLHYVVNIQYQKNSRSYAARGPVTTQPKNLRLNLEQPDDNSLLHQSSTIVSGKTVPKALVLITTDSQDLVIKSDPKGNFSTTLKLEAGVNNITAVVFDTGGEARSEERTVYYSKEKL